MDLTASSTSSTCSIKMETEMQPPEHSHNEEKAAENRLLGVSCENDDINAVDEQGISEDLSSHRMAEKVEIFHEVPEADDRSAVSFTGDGPSTSEMGKPPAPRRRRKSSKPQSPPFECRFCNRTFRWQSRYTEHVRTHTGEKPFMCRECGDDFRTSSYLKAHMRTHIGNAPFPCTLCDKAFHMPHLLREHRQRHIDEGAFRCVDCGINFTSGKKLGQHRVKVHPDDRPYECTECSAAFFRAGHLETHMRIHTGEKPFTCVECGAAFSTSSSLKVHTRSHTGEKPFACDQCDRAFVASSQLKKHTKTHTKIRYRKYRTVSKGEGGQSDTRKGSKTVDNIVSKSRNSDGITLPPQPEVMEGTNRCSEVKCEESEVKDTYKCDECGLVFKRSYEFASHVRHKHPNSSPKENMCRECGMVFSHPHSLKVHLRTHSGEKPFGCHICGHAFAHKSNLTAHYRAHTGEKPFKCEICGHGYSSPKYVRSHFLQVHNKTKAFNCGLCKAGFSDENALKLHLSSHAETAILDVAAFRGGRMLEAIGASKAPNQGK